VVRLKGDGSLIEFASAVDALAAAIDFQQTMIEASRDQPEDEAIVFRIGLHLGDIIVEGGDIYGDAVNVAARLEAQAPAGGIVVSRAVREAVTGRLKASLHALGELGLKNIERPIRAFRVEWSADDWPATEAISASASRGRASPRTAAPRKLAPPRLSIVVLPFANIGGKLDQEYFVDGVTESLTTDLSRMNGMLVIGRSTAFTYKGKHFDLKQIGRELDVRYVLEGSVQRSGNRMRVSAQLIDATTGNQLWAERFDKPVADLFDMQDEIVARLASQLGTQLIAAEARRAERRPRPGAMDFLFQGMAHFAQGATFEHLSQANVCFDRALTLDPGNIEALVQKALIDLVHATYIVNEDRAAHFAAAEAALTKALALAPEHAVAHTYLGYLQIMTNRAGAGMAACERALTLNRNLAGAHGAIGEAKIQIGRAEEAELHIQDALRLSPRDQFAYAWMSIAGRANLLLGCDEAAVAWFRRAIQMHRDFGPPYFWLAAALAYLDRLDEARSMVRTGLAFTPTYNLRRFREGSYSVHPKVLTQWERAVEGMRKAGLPE
jgi:TolB-like protein/Flp pilus assembly protein TadD